MATCAQDVRCPTKGKPVREEAMQYMARACNLPVTPSMTGSAQIQALASQEVLVMLGENAVPQPEFASEACSSTPNPMKRAVMAGFLARKAHRAQGHAVAAVCASLFCWL